MPETNTTATTTAAPAAEAVALVLGLAQALHKRAIYPAGHPLLIAASEALAARVMSTVARRGAMAIGIGRSQLIIDGLATEDTHPLLSDLARHLHGHHLAGVRLLPGVTREELDDFVAFVATPADRVEIQLGLLPDAELQRWRHIALVPSTFERLELAGESTAPLTDDREDPLWLELARSALTFEGLQAGERASPQHVARAMDVRLRGVGEARQKEIAGALMHLTSSLVGAAEATSNLPRPALQRRVSELVSALQPETLRRLLQLVGDDEQRLRLVGQAVEALSAAALVEIVNASATVSGRVVSGSLVRLLAKLARHSDSPNAGAAGAGRLLRTQVRKLIAEWTLDDPNPDGYAQMLRDLGTSESVAAADRQLDECEPERLLEISLASGTLGASTEVAVSRLVLRDGLAAVLDRLSAEPWSETREAVVDSLLDSTVLSEQLAAERPDLRVLEHAASRLRGRAVGPLLNRLQSREFGDEPWVADLLVLVGEAAVPVLTGRLMALSTTVQRLVLTVFDRLSARPQAADLQALGRHPDPALRLEALSLMIKYDDTRAAALIAGARDADEPIVALVVSTTMDGCEAGVAEILAQRLDRDEPFADGLRGRAVRAIATWSGSLQWLSRRPLTQHWLLRYSKLRKATPEMLACIGALATRWPKAPESALPLLLAGRSRDPRYRSAAAQGVAPA